MRELGVDPDASVEDGEGVAGRVDVRGPIPYTPQPAPCYTEPPSCASASIFRR